MYLLLRTCFTTIPLTQYLHYKIRGIIGSCVMDFRGSIVTCWRTSRMFHQSSCSSHHISLSVCLIGHFLQLLLTKNTFQINLQNSGHIGMVEEVRVPSEPDGKDVAKEEDTQGQGPVKVRHDHPIFKSVDDGDMERLQNYLEVGGLKLHDQ